MVELVAEIGASHNQDLNHCKNIIRLCRQHGFQAVKIQTWAKDSLASSYVIESGIWRGQDIVDLYAKAWLPWEYYPKLFSYAKKIGIELFSSVFDEESLSFLQGLGCPRYKIASCDIADIKLIQKVENTRKKVIVSTGMAYDYEINEVIDVFEGSENNLTLLICTSEYPAGVLSANLSRITRLIETKFKNDRKYNIGYSDHYGGHGRVASCAIVAGATMIESHVCLGESLDKNFSIDLDKDIHVFKKFIEEAINIVGSGRLGPSFDESKTTFKLKKSLHSKVDIKKGTIITEDMLCAMRPNLGDYLSNIGLYIGMMARDDIKEKTPINAAMFVL